MTAAQVIEWAFPTAQVVAMTCAVLKRWWAWYLTFSVQCLAFAFAGSNHAPSFYVQAFGCGFVAALGVVLWTRAHIRQRRDRADLWGVITVKYQHGSNLWVASRGVWDATGLSREDAVANLLSGWSEPVSSGRHRL